MQQPETYELAESVTWLNQSSDWTRFRVGDCFTLAQGPGMMDVGRWCVHGFDESFMYYENLSMGDPLIVTDHHRKRRWKIPLDKVPFYWKRLKDSDDPEGR